MSTVRVKICGITSHEDLRFVIEAGADAVGFVVDVQESPRNLSIEKAKKLIKSTPVFVESVAVLVPKNLDHLNVISRELNPNVLQIPCHYRQVKEINEISSPFRFLGVVQSHPDLNVDKVMEISNFFDAILLDSYVPGKYGGSGKIHNWNLSKRIRDIIYPKPLILAGGLNPENIKDAVRTVKPYAVDVSSGVEAVPGVKDRRKIIEFVRNAKGIEL